MLTILPSDTPDSGPDEFAPGSPTEAAVSVKDEPLLVDEIDDAEILPEIHSSPEADTDSAGTEAAANGTNAANRPPDLIQRSRYISRDLSWLRFNYRVLDQARDASKSLFDRLKFLAITASNLDE